MKALALLLAATTARADPCADAIVDPVATPVRDAGLDVQRGACARSMLTGELLAHALIDNPGFHGVSGGELDLGARLALGSHFEVGAQLRALDAAYVVNAVNSVLGAAFGPLVVTGAMGDPLGPHGRVALVGALELPITRSDTGTTRIGGQLAAVVTGELTPSLVLHARLGAVAAAAASAGGAVSWLAFRAGADLAWRTSAHVALQAGGDVEAGWYGGLDHVLVRAGIRFAPHAGRWRGSVGLGFPLGGGERTTAIADFGIARDLD